MRLTVLGSGSRGNALVVESDGDALLVDAGFPFPDLAARRARAGADTARLVGIAITHEHGDHARGAARAAHVWRVPVSATAGTLARLRLRTGTRTIGLAAGRPVTVGPFQVTAFPSPHDAAEPAVLVVEDAAGRRLGVAYDIGAPTAALHHACRGLDALVIEANHDEHLLRASRYPPSVRARIAGRGGHLSNRQCAAVVAAAVHAGLGLVVLAHVSQECNRPDLALDTVRAALRGTAFTGRLLVAAQDEPTPTVDVGRAMGQLVLPL